MAYFSSTQLDCFAAGYPDTPTTFRHNLEDHPLLKVERLAQLANSLPEDQLEYNLGAIDIDQSDWENTPGNGLSVEETLRNINVSGSWVALRNIESDTHYKELMMTCLEPVFPAVEALTGKAYRPEGFIFVSSPDAITPFHFDPEHNILMQIRGEKAMTVFPSAHERVVSPEQHETYHLGGHCNLEYADEMAAHGKTFSLAPGDALFLFTDGVTEAFNPAEEAYGEERLEETLREVNRAIAESDDPADSRRYMDALEEASGINPDALFLLWVFPDSTRPCSMRTRPILIRAPHWTSFWMRFGARARRVRPAR